MRSLTTKSFISAVFITVLYTGFLQAQEGYVHIDQDRRINKLMDLKKELPDTHEMRYRIQVFSGKFSSAKNVEMKVRSDFPQWPVRLDFDTPNYKVRIGRFKTRLEADRYLIEIRKKYPQAILLKPKKTT